MNSIYCCLILFFGLSLSQAFEVPPLVDSVVDQAGLLDSTAQQKLANALKVISEKGGPQVGVLTVDSIDPLTIEEASYKVVKSWQLGTAQKDNGVLLMIAKKERKVRIEVGQGVEGDLTDAYSRRIIDDGIVPLFRQGLTSEGIVFGVSEILKRMNPPYDLAEYLDVPTISNRSSRRGDVVDLIIMFCVLLFLIYSAGQGGGGRGFRRGYGAVYGGGFGGGFGGSSGGGGWSGGGGGFSGGGASGSW
ncbi:TPM domain-containing protein [bacterium]|nr:TPM domain-containing protein [bacterium]